MKKSITVAVLGIGAFLGLSDPSYALISWMKVQETRDAKVKQSEKTCKVKAQEMLQTDKDGKLPWGKQELSPPTWTQECIRAEIKDSPDPTQRNPKPYYQ